MLLSPSPSILPPLPLKFEFHYLTQGSPGRLYRSRYNREGSILQRHCAEQHQRRLREVLCTVVRHRFLSSITKSHTYISRTYVRTFTYSYIHSCLQTYLHAQVHTYTSTYMRTTYTNTYTTVIFTVIMLTITVVYFVPQQLLFLLMPFCDRLINYFSTGTCIAVVSVDILTSDLNCTYSFVHHNSFIRSSPVSPPLPYPNPHQNP